MSSITLLRTLLIVNEEIDGNYNLVAAVSGTGTKYSFSGQDNVGQYESLNTLGAAMAKGEGELANCIGNVFELQGQVPATVMSQLFSTTNAIDILGEKSFETGSDSVNLLNSQETLEDAGKVMQSYASPEESSEESSEDENQNPEDNADNNLENQIENSNLENLTQQEQQQNQDQESQFDNNKDDGKGNGETFVEKED